MDSEKEQTEYKLSTLIIVVCIFLIILLVISFLTGWLSLNDLLNTFSPNLFGDKQYHISSAFDIAK